MNPLKGIVAFNIERNLSNFDQMAEYKMLEEELQEFLAATNDNDRVDALCDLIVVATGGLHKLGYNPTLALDETVKHIRSRKGALNEETGKWQKDPNQDPDTLYEPVYAHAKR